MKILYIAGAGRSGSTLLDMALGQVESVFSCGELSNLSVVVRDGLLCSCGEVVAGCSFWKQVLAQTGSYSAVQELVLNHSRSVSSWLWVFAGTRQKRYIEWMDSVYDAIGQASGAAAIVDSSKSPVRLAALLRHSRHEIYVIHLVRDPSVVAASLSKPLKRDIRLGVQNDLERKSQLRTYAFWTVINSMVHMAALLAGKRYVRVTYEAFTLNPSTGVQRVLSYFGFGPGNLFLETQPLKGGHLMAGNRLRLKNNILISGKMQTPLGVRVSSAAGVVVSWPLRRLYRYRR